MRETQIHEAVGRLREAAPNATRIILFGSHARGDAGPESDVDLLVVVRGAVDRRREMVRLRRVLRPLRIPVDLLVVTEEEVREWGALPGTALFPALREGKILHEAA